MPIFLWSTLVNHSCPEIAPEPEIGQRRRRWRRRRAPPPRRSRPGSARAAAAPPSVSRPKRKLVSADHVRWPSASRPRSEGFVGRRARARRRVEEHDGVRPVLRQRLAPGCRRRRTGTARSPSGARLLLAGGRVFERRRRGRRRQPRRAPSSRRMQQPAFLDAAVDDPAEEVGVDVVECHRRHALARLCELEVLRRGRARRRRRAPWRPTRRSRLPFTAVELEAHLREAGAAVVRRRGPGIRRARSITAMQLRRHARHGVDHPGQRRHVEGVHHRSARSGGS